MPSPGPSIRRPAHGPDSPSWRRVCIEVDGGSGRVCCAGARPLMTAAGAGSASRRALQRLSVLRGGTGPGDARRSGRQRWPGPGRSVTTGVSRASSPEGGRNSGVGDDGSAEPGGGERVWRELRSNPDYVADWRAHADEPAPLEPAPFPLRAQTVADLAAASLGLLAWEDPGVGSRASPLWADVPMVKGVVAKPEGPDGQALSDAVRESDATCTGLRLRDGTFILKVARGPEGGADQSDRRGRIRSDARWP